MFSTKYARRFYAASVREFGEWIKGVFRHWIAVCGGVVALILFAYGLWYQSSPPLITWVILLACLFAATFLAWRDEHRRAKRLQSELEEQAKRLQSDLEEQSKRVLDKASELLKAPSSLMPFNALYAAGAPHLLTNEQLFWVADKISEHHDHPLQWMEKYVYRDEWLSFLQWGKHHPDLNFDKGGDYLKGVTQWAVERNRATEESIAEEVIREWSERN
jgi:hypothetical protein